MENMEPPTYSFGTWWRPELAASPEPHAPERQSSSFGGKESLKKHISVFLLYLNFSPGVKFLKSWMEAAFFLFFFFKLNAIPVF